MNTYGSEVSAKVMQEIARTELRYKLAFFAAAAMEVALLAALLLLADPKDRTHLLLLAGFVGSYTVIVLGLVALGAHVSRTGQRILRAFADARSAERELS